LDNHGRCEYKVSLIPDFISNCGMARVFAYFMEKKVQMTDEAVFKTLQKSLKMQSRKRTQSAVQKKILVPLHSK
jgi:hypothetical protein